MPFKEGNTINKGRKLSEIHKKKISDSHIGKKRPDMSGKKHWNWKGGKFIAKNKYIYIYKPDHPRAISNRVLEHVLNAAKMLGRYLTKEERVHHINFIKSDNREENIYIFKNNSEHGKVVKSYFNLAHILIKKGIIVFNRKKGEYILSD